MKQFLLFQDHPVLSLLLWATLAIVLLYMARKQAHQAIRSFSRVLSTGFRLAARSVLGAEQRLRHRNREVLLAAGMRNNFV